MFQQDKTGKAYASWTLRPSEQSMHNYSSAKLELLALKQAVTKKFRDYLLGSKFTVLTGNNPIAYIQTSKLGTSQICWLSKLALFNFNILYRLSKTDKAIDALGQHAVDPDLEMESVSDNDSEELSHVVIFHHLQYYHTSPRRKQNPICFKKEVQAVSNVLEGEISVNVHEYMKYPILLYRPV